MTEAPKPGMAVDASGGPVVDPTRNVLDLVRAAIERQDDLRKGEAALVQSQMSGLRDLFEAKFDGIDREFSLIESRRIEQKNDTKTAVDAALSAAERAVREQAAASEKAIIKSETSVAAQSLQQAQTFSAQLKGVETTVDDTKERVGQLEVQRQGGVDSRTNHRLDIGMIIGILGFLVAAAMMIITMARA